MPVQNLNLIPDEVVKESELKSSQSKAIIISVVFLSLSLLAMGISFYFVTSSKSTLSALQNENKKKVLELKSLENLELNAQITQNRLAYISNIFSNKIFYSKLLQEVSSKSSSQVSIGSVEIGDNFTVNLAGVSNNTLALQNYVNNLVKGPNNLFSNAKIMSLETSEGLGSSKFSVQVTADKKMLLKPNE